MKIPNVKAMQAERLNVGDRFTELQENFRNRTMFTVCENIGDFIIAYGLKDIGRANSQLVKKRFKKSSTIKRYWKAGENDNHELTRRIFEERRNRHARTN
jgi:hypothetical protein